MKKWMTHAVAAMAAASVAGGLAWWWRGASSPVPYPADGAKEETEAAETMYNCPMHPWIIKDKPGNCPICGMALVPMKDHGHGAPVEAGRDAVRIDPAVIQNMGVKTEEVRVRELSKTIRLSGKLAEDETRQVSVNARIMGWVEKLHADYLGKPVKAGEVLMELYSPDLLATQEEFLQALRYARSLPEGALPETRRGAEDLVQSARRRLEYWDIPAAAIDALAREGQVKRTLPIVSPASGVVVAKNVVEGRNIMAGTELFRIADLSRIWALGEVYQEDLAFVRPGQKARVLISYLPGRVFEGRVSFIAPVLDLQSKTALVRVELRNTPDQLLKPGMVADVEVSFPLGKTLAVPNQAIIRTGRRNVAIVSLGQGYFEPREVELGASADEYVQVLEGLSERDLLVTSSQFLIDSESNLKSAVMSMGLHDHGGGLGAQGSSGRPGGRGEKDAAANPGSAVKPGTRPVAGDSHGPHAAQERTEAPQAFRKGLGSLFEAYLPLQAALAADDAAAAHRAARGMKAALEGVEPAGLADTGEWTDSREMLLASLAAMDKAAELEGMRGSFRKATETLIALLRRYGYEAGGEARVFHCPMAMEGRGADWMQDDTVLRNPYFGASMSSCGEARGMI